MTVGDFNIHEVVLVDGSVYKLGRERVIGFEWENDGIIVNLEPTEVTEGDSDVPTRYHWNLFVPIYQIHGVVTRAREEQPCGR